LWLRFHKLPRDLMLICLMILSSMNCIFLNYVLLDFLLGFKDLFSKLKNKICKKIILREKKRYEKKYIEKIHINFHLIIDRFLMGTYRYKGKLCLRRHINIH
jgi:hypothetical protein